MPASFAGINLHLGDPGGVLQDWCDRFKPLEDIFPVCDPLAARSRPQTVHGHPVGLPVFNWSLRPSRWRLNSLWWPTGASRFGIGLFTCTKAAATQILAQVGSSGGSGTLHLSDGNRSIDVTMYLLPPRPIGGAGTANPVMLLPLVDARYFWQSISIGQTFVSPDTTWAQLRSILFSQLGASVTASDPDGYPAPDWSEWDRFYHNAAQAIDGYAATVGQRFVAGFGGSYSLQTSGQASSSATSNLAAIGTIAGGECLSSPAIYPGSVSVAFQRRQGGIPYQNGVCDLVTKTAITYGINTTGPGAPVIHTTFQADYSGRNSNADNQAAMIALADSIARDFYAWRAKNYSATAPGIASAWSPCGFDDFLWIMLGTQVGSIDVCDDDEPEAFRADEFEKPSPYLAQTQIESLPPNFGVDENLSQAPSPKTFRPMPVFRVQLTDNFQPQDPLPAVAPGAMLYAADYPPTGVLSQDAAVQVFDTMNCRGSLGSGAKVWVAALGADSEMFELISGASENGDVGDIVVFQLYAESTVDEPMLNLAGTATARLCQLNGATNDYEATTRRIVVVDFFRDPGEWQGMANLRGLGRKRGFRMGGVDAYDIIWMERPALFTYGTLSGGTSPGIYASTADTTSLSYFQQGNKPPPNRSQVFDPQTIYPYTSGPITGVNDSTPSDGSKFLSAWNDRTKTLDFVVAQQQTFYVTATLKDNLKRTDPVGRAIEVQTQMFSPFNLGPKDNAAEGLLFKNPLNYIGRKDKKCLLVWGEVDQSWILVAVDDREHVGFVRLAEDSSVGLIDVTDDPKSAVFTYQVATPDLIAAQVRFVDLRSLAGIGTDKLVAELDRWYPATLVDFAGGDPVYEACVGEQQWEAQREEDLAKGSDGDFELLDADDNPTGIMINANAKWKKFTGGKKAMVKRMPGGMLGSKWVAAEICGS